MNNKSERKGWFDERFDEMPNRHRFDCMSCGRPMFFPKSKLGKYKTCGSDCSTALRQQRRDERSRACETCGTQFVPRPRQIAMGHGRYCSQKCNIASHQAVNSPEAQAKSRASWMKTFLSGGARIRRGTAHRWWNGGPEEARKRVLAYQVQYRKRNPDKLRVWSSNRRAKGGGKVSGSVAAFLLKVQRHRCAVCRASVSSKKYHLDHITPISRGGRSELGNLQVLCPSCNLRKSAKDPIRFMQEQGYLL